MFIILGWVITFLRHFELIVEEEKLSFIYNVHNSKFKIHLFFESTIQIKNLKGSS